MKKRYKIVAAIIFAIVVGLVIIYMSTKNTTFKEVVLDHLNVMEVSSIEIIRKTDAINENRITVTDPSQIELIMNAFSRTKMREASFSNINYTESYWITLKTNENRKFGITLYDNDYVNIFEYNSKKNTTKSYKITNEFDPIVIRGLFK
ncbi:hypothetical protein [Desulfosporosinus sp. I2]|uniref:hypothetical protein n=1 Tax=Desulfosporosinus sp. I2 TaxID=1617025 RepID=UPI0005EFF56B|nr:hypothetical protein [Desulfosporosinus sp. I2]